MNSMNSTSENTTTNPLCFVVGPIGSEGSDTRKHADLLLHAVVKFVLEAGEFNYRVKRADEDTDPGMIGDRVIADILYSDLVIADLTDLNANAFYELGIRHATEKPTIHMASTGTKLPFDNVSHRTLFVDLSDWHSIDATRKRLADFVRATKAPNYKVSNPITQANASVKMRKSADPRDQFISQLQDRLSIIENKIRLTTRSARIPADFSSRYYMIIDTSAFVGNHGDQVIFDYDASTTFGEVLDRIFFLLEEQGSDVKPYTYDKSWVLIDERGSKLASHKALGVDDDRLIKELNVHSGDVLRVVRLSA